MCHKPQHIAEIMNKEGMVFIADLLFPCDIRKGSSIHYFNSPAIMRRDNHIDGTYEQDPNVCPLSTTSLYRENDLISWHTHAKCSRQFD
jgi:hypothetical protein